MVCMIVGVVVGFVWTTLFAFAASAVVVYIIDRICDLDPKTIFDGNNRGFLPIIGIAIATFGISWLVLEIFIKYFAQ